MSIPTNIRVLALDVDGVLTDGTVAFTGLLETETKLFHVHGRTGHIVMAKKLAFMSY